jgi:hypothetical protein
MKLETVPPHGPPYHHSINDLHPTSSRLHPKENPQRNPPAPANPAIALPSPLRRQLLDARNPELQLGFRCWFAQHSSSVRAWCVIFAIIAKEYEILLAPRRLPSPASGCPLPHERYLCSRDLVVWRARTGSCSGGIGQGLGRAGSLDRVCGLGSLVAWLGCGGDLCLVWSVPIVVRLVCRVV